MKYLIIFSLLLLTSCMKDPQEVYNKGNFKIGFLFEHDGCKMYRFDDGSDPIYWSDCSGRTSYKTQANKASINHEVITTE